MNKKSKKTKIPKSMGIGIIYYAVHCLPQWWPGGCQLLPGLYSRPTTSVWPFWLAIYIGLQPRTCIKHKLRKWHNLTVQQSPCSGGWGLLLPPTVSGQCQYVPPRQLSPEEPFHTESHDTHIIIRLLSIIHYFCICLVDVSSCLD